MIDCGTNKAGNCKLDNGICVKCRGMDASVNHLISILIERYSNKTPNRVQLSPKFKSNDVGIYAAYPFTDDNELTYYFYNEVLSTKYKHISKEEVTEKYEVDLYIIDHELLPDELLLRDILINLEITFCGKPLKICIK